jgi:hypothetical protein
MKGKKLFALLGMLCVFGSSATAQNINDALRYTTFQPSFGSFDQALGGSSALYGDQVTGHLHNPAAAGFVSSSSFSFELNVNHLSSESDFLGNTRTESNQLNSVNNARMLLDFPTEQGSFIFSLGYNRVADFSNYFLGSGFNESSTISDYLAATSDPNTRLIGYNGYAADSANTATGLQSIMRYNPYQGIDQYVEQTESGQMGEAYLSMATEFQKNFFVGATLSFPIGEYSYKRSFIERDLQNAYTESPFDVSNLLVADNIDAEITGFYARLGMVYKFTESDAVGFSYQTPYTLTVKENYSTEVITRYDDGFAASGEFQNRLEGNFNYDLEGAPVYSVQGKTGLGIENLNLSLQAEYVDYEMVAFAYDSEFSIDELDVNEELNENVTSILNLKGGLSYQIGSVTPAIGLAYLPSNRTDVDNDRMFYSGGASIIISPALSVQASAQYVQTDDSQLMYSVPGNSPYSGSETLSYSTDRFSFMVGVKYNFRW